MHVIVPFMILNTGVPLLDFNWSFILVFCSDDALCADGT